MKVFVLVLFFLMPNGEERVSMTRVSNCPSEAALTESLKSLSEQKLIKSGRAFCGELNLGQEA